MSFATQISTTQNARSSNCASYSFLCFALLAQTLPDSRCGRQENVTSSAGMSTPRGIRVYLVFGKCHGTHQTRCTSYLHIPSLEDANRYLRVNARTQESLSSSSCVLVVLANFLSLLTHYYDINAREECSIYFKDSYIETRKPLSANSHLVLHFDLI